MANNFRTSSKNQRDIIKLKAKGYNLKEIAEKLDLSYGHVKNVSSAFKYDKDALEHFKQNQADCILNLAKDVLSTLTLEDVMQVNAYQRAVIFSILYEKYRLVSNQSTQNINIIERIITEAHKNPVYN